MAKKLPKPSLGLPSAERIEQSIYVIRGQRVMIDSDLARLYGVATAAVNQAVLRNEERFPEDFSFILTWQEFTDLKSQTVISSLGHGGRRTPPRVFTEHGVAMLSSVLRSPTAVSVNIAIMRTFVRLRRLLATPGELVQQLTGLAETVKLHDHQIRAITDVLQRMMEHPTPPRRRKGFHVTPDSAEPDP
ncbi:MAG: DNA-binding protein [Pirellula sp.]|nr:DNA-binding protein [Pirellula sp.]